MSAQTQNGRPTAEAIGTPVGQQRASAVSLFNNTTARPEREPLWMRVDRFLADLAESRTHTRPLLRVLDDTTEVGWPQC